MATKVYRSEKQKAARRFTPRGSHADVGTETLFRNRTARGDVFLDARGLAFQSAQVVQLGAAHLALALDLHRIDRAAVRLEHALHAGAMRHLAHGEGRMQAAIALGDHDALERLHALAVAFLHLDVDDHGIAGAELGQLAAHLRGFELFNDLVHGIHRDVRVRLETRVTTFSTLRLAKSLAANPAAATMCGPAPASGASAGSPRGRRTAIPPAPRPVRATPAACSAGNPAGRSKTNPAAPTARRSTRLPATGRPRRSAPPRPVRRRTARNRRSTIPRRSRVRASARPRLHSVHTTGSAAAHWPVAEPFPASAAFLAD